MTTDTIPEAVELAAKFLTEYKGKPLVDYVTEACLAYHKRRLGECLDMEPLIQARIAKAVEEATASVRVALECDHKAFEDKQKQCEELRQALQQSVNASIGTGKERDDLRTRLKEQAELHTMQLAAIMTASIQNTEATIKDRIGPSHDYATVAYSDVCQAVNREMRERTRAEKAEADAATIHRTLSDELSEEKKLSSSYYNRWMETIDKQKKAEAEVAELRKWRDEDLRMLREQIRVAVKSYNQLHDQLTQLQQDVRPLVALFSSVGMLPGRRELLETFLAKHPELNP